MKDAIAEPADPKVSWEDRDRPVKGEHYRHTKSREIYIIHDVGCSANNPKSGESAVPREMVSYRSMGQNTVWFRDLEEFLGVGSNNNYRFLLMVPVDPSNPRP